MSARGRVPGHVDAVLTQKGLQRHVRLTLPHVLAVPAAIAATDCIVTLASRIAHSLAADYRLKMFAPPIEIDGFDIAMAWKPQMTNDLAIQWLRSELITIGKNIM